MVAALLGLLAAGFALQVAFFAHHGHSALSDLPRVFLHRGISPTRLPYVDRVLEYPVGAGILLYLATLVAPTAFGVLIVTALAATAVCGALVVALERRCGARAWRWAVGTPLLLFAFQNWDVFAIGALVVGLVAFERGQDRVAGGAFGVGAAVKLFPLAVVPPLFALRWSRGDRRGAWQLAGSAAAVLAIVNLPFLLARPSGWWWPVAFQGARQATWGTAWFSVDRLLGVAVHGAAGAHVANSMSLAALAVGLGWLTLRTFRVRLDPVAASAAAVAIFVLANKVWSPTYDLWLVVFFVLLPVSRRLWVAFCAVDLAVFAVVYGSFHGVTSAAFVHEVLPVFVAIRVAVVLVLIHHATRPVTYRAARPRDLANPSRSR
jgi:uncharacterized membrane protein